jgi:hypothetical protein
MKDISLKDLFEYAKENHGLFISARIEFEGFEIEPIRLTTAKFTITHTEPRVSQLTLPLTTQKKYTAIWEEGAAMEELKTLVDDFVSELEVLK